MAGQREDEEGVAWIVEEIVDVYHRPLSSAQPKPVAVKFAMITELRVTLKPLLMLYHCRS